jgi:hypothetical protein
MALRTFDPKEVSVIVGEFIIAGFSEDQITVVRDNPAWEMVVGAGGEGTRVKSNDKSGTITITLQQASPSNDNLSSLALLDELSNTGLRPFFLKDNLGTTVYSAATVYVEQIPEAAFGKTQNDRVWTLKTDSLIQFLGSNPIG